MCWFCMPMCVCSPDTQRLATAAQCIGDGQESCLTC